MCAVAGEVADGVRLHPICTTRFIDESVKPAVERGALAAGRQPSEIEFCMKPLVATAPDETSLAVVTETVRARVAFYLSTPAYRRVFDLHEWSDRAEQAAALSKAHRWDELSDLVDDDMLRTVATVGTHATIAEQLRERYRTRVDRIEFSIPVVAPGDGDTLRHLLAAIRAD
jgi:alkanesulfonate monooxygenase SsuD/methylene tetrahydromethanopterin reductase-like flavin-dependent oxidoreductase (luciferase family)